MHSVLLAAHVADGHVAPMLAVAPACRHPDTG